MCVCVCERVCGHEYVCVRVSDENYQPSMETLPGGVSSKYSSSCLVDGVCTVMNHSDCSSPSICDSIRFCSSLDKIGSKLPLFGTAVIDDLIPAQSVTWEGGGEGRGERGGEGRGGEGGVRGEGRGGEGRGGEGKGEMLIKSWFKKYWFT